MDARWISRAVLLFVLTDISCNFQSPAVIKTHSLSATEDSCVQITCTVTGNVLNEDALWFWMKDGIWDANINEFGGGKVVYSNKISEKGISPEFEGRVNFAGSVRLSSNNPSCSVCICNLTTQDSGRYFFRYIRGGHRWKTKDADLTVHKNPCPITFNASGPVQSGSKITLICSTLRSCSSHLSIQSVPPSQVKTSEHWFSSKVTATFSTSWQDHNREFTCQTQGNMDKHLVKKIRLSVQYAPHDTVAVLSSDDVLEGDSLTLTCSAKAQPPPTFTWYKIQAGGPPPTFTWYKIQAGGPPPQRQTGGSPLHTGAEWKMNYIQTGYNGEYVCTAQNIHGTEDSNVVQIDVKYAPTVEVKSSPQPPYRQGQTVTLTCDVVRSSPQPYLYTWSKGQQRLNWGQTYVKRVQPEDSGSYTCSATNTVGTSGSRPLQMDVQYAPKNTIIEVVGGNIRAPVGRSVVFRCVTNANPAAGRYDWYKRTHTRPDLVQTNTENSLELRSLQRADEACYSCRAKNTLGIGHSSPDQCLQVLYPPSKPTLSMDTEVREGQSMSITCTVESSPVSTLTLNWTKGNSSQELKKSDNNSLSYTLSMSWDRSGEYTCLAHNSLGSNSHQRTLTVKHRPQEVTVQADPGLTVKENMTLTLRCSAQSHPPVTSVTWTLPGQEPRLNAGPTFTIHSVTVSNSGLYRCTAHNDIGEGTSPTADVQVHFGPKHVEVLTWENQAADGTRSVTLRCSSHSVPPVTLYAWYRRTDGQEDIKVSENRNLTVVSTQSGLYYCTARNRISESSSETVPLYQDGGYVKFVVLALVPFLIISIGLLVFRLKRKTSVQQEGSANTSRRVLAGPAPGENEPESLNYASLHFEKKTRAPVKTEEDVVYSTVNNPRQEMADIYENINTVQKARRAVVPESDISEDEVDVKYAQVNFRTKASRRSEEEYSELKF